MKTCPYCGEEVNAKAVKCRHCGELIDPKERSRRQRAKVRAYQLRTIGVFVMLAAVALAAFIVYVST